jgi:glycosyltransferase involved in cell wall biosynthesis
VNHNKSLKILHVNTLDQGGAGRAVYRLHKSLLDQSVDSQILVQSKSSDDPTVVSETSQIRKVFNKVRPHLDSIPVRFYKNKTKTLFSSSWLPFSNTVHKINEINPDIVHLHWVCNGMMRIEDIPKIKAPIVWTLHDNWAFTGGCHIAWECEKYKNNCGNCPRLGSDTANDLSRKTFKRKRKYFLKIKKIIIVGVSKWITNCSKSSALLKDKNHTCLPNPIDTDIYKPFDKEVARELWNLPIDKKLVIFGANDATNDPNKGFKELSEALPKLTNKNIELVVFGSSKPKKSKDFGFKTHYLGHLYDDASLVTLYSAADVMVVPSLQEAFGQTASESMACGTPVVAFGSTGLLDIVEHKNTGYLAKPYVTLDLARGIDWVLSANNYDELCQNARQKVLMELDGKIVAKKYIALYKGILNEY